MKVLAYLKTFVDDFKAHRRGERRVAERGLRGRVYAKDGETPQSTSFSVKKTPKATLTMTITRVDGTVERVVVPAHTSKLPPEVAALFPQESPNG